jgi:hypothetical protein
VTPQVIAGNTRSNLWKAWLFAVLWNLVSAPLFVLVPREIERNPMAAVAVIFPLVGFGSLVWAVMTTLRWRRFGPSRFEMSPAALGGNCSGTIHTRLAPDEVRSIRVLLKLTCLERITKGTGKNRRQTETILWREEYTVPDGQVGFGAFGATIPVRFALPSDARETTVTGRSDGIVWVLAADASIPGVDFKEDFDVPVGRDESSVSFEPARVNVFAPAREAVSTMDLAQSGIHVNPTAHGTEYYFEAARNRSFAAGTTFFLVLWTGFLWLQYVLEAPWIFIVVTGFFELLLLIIVSELWFGSTTVSIGSENVQRRVGMFGTGATRVIPAQSIKKVDLYISMQSTGRTGTPYYEIRATLDTGKHKHLGSGIRNKRHAEWVADRMRKEIGLAA